MMSMMAMRSALRRASSARTLRNTSTASWTRLKSTGSGRPSPSALGLKDASQGQSFSTNTKFILGYITFGVAAMATIASVKERSEDVEESARIFNMAKRAVVKDRRLFEAIGYPKTFERIDTPDANAETGMLPPSSVFEGTFKALGDEGTAIVTYKHRAPETAEKTEDAAANVPIFEVLTVRLDNGSEFSALESYVQNEEVGRQQKASSLGKKLLFPVLGGVVLGGISSFLIIRIVRNRPFYVHKLVLDHANNSDVARKLLGHPITSDRKAYVGSLTDAVANYSVACKGPKGEGTLIVKAYKNAPEGDDAASTGSTVMATPGTDWKFSTLVLSVKRNELRKEKEKTAKTVDLLAGLSKEEKV